jgi:hypothetical protein
VPQFWKARSSKHRKQQESGMTGKIIFWVKSKIKKNHYFSSNSAFWPLLGAIRIYSWSSGCLPIIADFGDFGLIVVVIISI